MSRRCLKSRFPIRIIVFDELELNIFVSQGLTLLTASLVHSNFFIFSDTCPEVLKKWDLREKLFDGARNGFNLNVFKTEQVTKLNRKV